ncbi:MAG: orotidine-5'-phosphate decarboxylase [Pseudonocardiaceae bacterium]
MVEVIVALDLPRGTEALRLLDRLREVRWVKVGPALMTREGPAFLQTLIGRGLSVFLDLKWHDIPNTVAEAVMAARELGVAMATLHTLGGGHMMEAAAVSAGADLALVGVTVLTSHDRPTYARAVGRRDVDLEGEVERQAGAALEAGLRGVVCSPREVALVRRRLGPEPFVVVPGIRRRSDPLGDQVRVATAKDAVTAGATHLVVGRPVLLAPDPAAAFRDILQEARCVAS